MDLRNFRLSGADKQVLLILGLMHFLWFCLALILDPGYMADSLNYVWQALNLAERGELYAWNFDDPIDVRMYSQRPPVYSLFIVAFRWLSQSFVPLFLLQNLLSIFNLWGAWKIIDWFKSPSGEKMSFSSDKKTFASRMTFSPSMKRTTLFWVPVLLFFPAQFIYANLVMSEILFQSCLIWAFFFLIRFEKRGQSGDLLVYNLLLVAGMLTKPVLYLFWAPNLLICLYFALKKRQLKVSALGLIPLLAVLTWSGFNYQRTGYFHYSSISGINLLHYNTYYTLVDVYGVERADSMLAEIEAEVAVAPDFASQEAVLRSRSTALLAQHPVAYAGLHLKGMVNFFLDPGRFDLYHFFGWERADFQGLLYFWSRDGYRGVVRFFRIQPVFPLILMSLIFLWNLITTFTLLFFFFRSDLPWWFRISLVIAVGYICFATGPLGASRFKVPVYPFLVVAWGYFFTKKLKPDYTSE